MPTRRVATVLAAVVAYGAAVIALTWPLAPRARTHALASPAPFDTFALTWALAHQSRAWVHDPAHPGRAGIYHPTPNGLWYVAAGTGAVPYFAPGFLATGNPVLALNVMILVATTLTAVALHCVVQGWTASPAAGIVAATTFLASPIPANLLPWTPNYAVVFYVPLLVAAVARPLGSLWAALGIGMLLAAQGLVDLYLAPAVFVAPALVALGRLARRSRRAEGGRLLVALAAGVAGMAPVLLAYLRVRYAEPRLFEQSPWIKRATLGAIAERFELLRVAYPLYAGPIPKPALALIVLAAAVWIVRRRPRVLPPGVLAHVLLWLACGLALWSRASWDLLAALVPALDVVRVPYRLGVLVILAYGLLAGLAFAVLESSAPPWRGRRPAAMVVAFAVGAASCVTMGRFLPPRRDGAGRQLVAGSRLWEVKAADPALLALIEGAPPGPLVEIPALRRGRPIVLAQARAEFRAIYHRRPVLNGYGSYWPAGFLRRMALAERMPGRAAVDTLRRETGLAVVVVHEAGLPRARANLWRRVAARGGSARLRFEGRAGRALVFSVRPPV